MSFYRGVLKEAATWHFSGSRFVPLFLLQSIDEIAVYPLVVLLSQGAISTLHWLSIVLQYGLCLV